MTSCSVNTTLPQSELKYLDGRCISHIENKLPVFKTLAPVITGYPLYGQNDDKSGFYLIKPQAATNFISNPVFYNDLNNWGRTNVGAIRTNEWSFDSGFSARLTGSGDTTDPLNLRSYIETEVRGFITGVAYVASVYGWQPEIFDNQDSLYATISIVQQEIDDLGIVQSETEVISESIGKVSRWDRIAVSTVILPTTTNVFVRLNLRGDIKRQLFAPFDPVLDDGGNQIFNSTDEYLFFDMIQFELGNSPTTPFHGDTFTCASSDKKGHCGDYSWEGFPHASPSFRSECARDGGILVSLTDLGFAILNHSGHDGMAVTNLAQPYSNRPGSNYQKSILPDSRILTFSSSVCGCSLADLECKTFDLQSLIMPQVGGCNGKVLLVYHHDPDYCGDNCDVDRDLCICAVYLGGFEYTRDNNFQQRIVLQFEVHDPLAWSKWPGSNSIALDFAEGLPGNKVIKIEQEGGYSSFPIETNRDIRDIACLPGTSDFIIGGEFDSINANSVSDNLLVLSCNEVCALQGGGFNGAVNVLKHTASGDVIFGGAFSGSLGIIYGDNLAQGYFPAYPGNEVFAIDKPFWAQIMAGTDSAIHLLDNNDNWITWTTNGRVLDLQTDNTGNIYAVGEFTEIDGTSFNRVARLNVNQGGCLDTENAAWESIGYGFSDRMNTIALNMETNTLYFGGLADIAIPDQVTICNEVILRSTDSKGSGFGCNFLFSLLFSNFIDGSNPQIIAAGGSALCAMDFELSSEGVIAGAVFPANPTVTLNVGQQLLRLEFPYPVTNVILELAGLESDETLDSFNILPNSVTGDFTLNGNFLTSSNCCGSLTWDGPLTELEMSYNSFTPGTVDNIVELVSLEFGRITSGNGQQFTFVDLGGGVTRFDIAFSNAIAQQFLIDCLTNPVTTLQERYARITASNNQGINYNFLIGDQNINAISSFESAGLYIVRLDIDSITDFADPCASLNTPFANEFNRSNGDLEQFKTLILSSGGLGVDNAISTIKIQCLTLDIGFQGDDIAINHVACLDGQNLTPLGDGFTTEVYDLMVHPCTKEIFAGHANGGDGLRVWNGQDWFDYPGVISGDVINMDFCRDSFDVFLLTDTDGSHIVPGVTAINYFGNFENLNAILAIHGPGDLEFIQDNCENKIARFCASVECGEIAILNMANGKFTGSRSFDSTVLGGSRLDFWLQKCGQSISMFMGSDGPSTKATLIYQDQYWGVNAICCAGKGNGLNNGGYLPAPSSDIANCCNNAFLQHREPTELDCSDEGWQAGNMWLNTDIDCGVRRLFINTGEDCPNCDNAGLAGNAGEFLLDDNGNEICIE